MTPLRTRPTINRSITTRKRTIGDEKFMMRKKCLTSQALAPLGWGCASRAGLMLKLEKVMVESRAHKRLSSPYLFTLDGRSWL